jgi:hypothetical protein
MCGRLIHPHPTSDGNVIAVPHDRDDIISMLQRGDFD